MSAAVEIAVVADDLGICAERDKGIFECMREGAVTATVVVPNGLSASSACKTAIRLGLTDRVGLHLNISQGVPLSPWQNVESLLHHDAESKSRVFCGIQELQKRRAAGALDFEHIAHEFRQQLLWFREQFKHFPRFVNGHQHCHIFFASREVARVFRDCGVQYIRNTQEKFEGNNDAVPPLCPRCSVVSALGRKAMDIYKVRSFR